MNTTASERQKPHPLKLFTLDLLYPAVLGSMIVLLFLRLANFGLMALTEPTTLFGILLSIYYVLGFVNAKYIVMYGFLLALLDCISSLLVFICFFILGFNEQSIPGKGGPSADYSLLFLFLIAVFASPPARRFLVSGKIVVTEKRTIMAASAALLAVGGLLNAKDFSLFQWLTPIIVVTALYLILLIYFLDLLRSGIGVEGE